MPKRTSICSDVAIKSLFFLAFCRALLGNAIGAGFELDLTRAIVVAPVDASAPELKAVQMLLEEVEKRTGVRWSMANAWPTDASIPVIAVGRRDLSTKFAGPFASEFAQAQRGADEGFTLRVKDRPQTVLVVGNDERGVLFGVGKLLRAMSMTREKIVLRERLDLTTSPWCKLRGHQLGYRPKTNSYDAWDLPQWEQYYRDLAVFGTNTIELVPPKSDDDDTSPHFPRPKMEMMIGMSQLAKDYGLDVWIWYPALDGDYGDPKIVETSLREWGEVLSKLPRVDAIFIPTGDPGRTRPSILMPMLQQQARQLREIHPKAQVWISAQGLTQEWWDELMDVLATEPEWLTGVGYGPQTRVSLPELRATLPSRYQIRRYPDITHCMWCQYPVADWDVAFPLTEGREGVNPRPVDQAVIFRAFKDYANGFITYSEGCNDDVNKIIWSGLGWNPDEDVTSILRDYSRYFIDDSLADDFAQGLFSLERNWRVPLLNNASIGTTLLQFQDMERSASGALFANWRFQQALYRAYYDAYLRQRLVYETALEESAMEVLRSALKVGSLAAMTQAEAILERAKSARVADDLRSRVFVLAEALYQSIRMQLSVPKYKAIAPWRGANLDAIDVPLNDIAWLRLRFAQIRKLPSEEDRLREIDAIVRWTDPGPGGFYDDLGDPARQPHLVRQSNYDQDPAFLKTGYSGFENEPGWRRSWYTHADGLFATPMVLHYQDLDPEAAYKVRVVYAGDNFRWKVRLATIDGVEIHPWMDKPKPVAPIEFNIPPSETARGKLTLLFTADPTRGGNGRGAQVAEVWLMKKQD